MQKQQILWWKRKEMCAWYETEKDKGKREMQESRTQHWAQRKLTCQRTLFEDITSALLLETLNRPRTGLSELWCCQKSYKSLDRQVSVPYLHWNFRSPLLLATAVCCHSSVLWPLQTLPWEGTHVSEQKSMLQDLDWPSEAWGSCVTHEQLKKSESTQNLCGS